LWIALSPCFHALLKPRLTARWTRRKTGSIHEQDGVPYYICVYDKDAFLNAVKETEAAEEFMPIIENIPADTAAKLIIVFEAETGMPRALSIDACNYTGTLPGLFFGEKEDVNYECKNMYATLLFDKTVDEFEIPEGVFEAAKNQEEETLSDALLFDIEDLLSDAEAIEETAE